MQEFIKEIKGTVTGVFLCLLLMVTGSWLLGHAEYIPGLLLGNLTSIIYYLFIAQRIKKSADLPVAKAIATMRTGWLVRLSFIVLVLILSLKLSYIHFGAAIAGLFSLQIVFICKAVMVLAQSFRASK